MFSTRPRVVAFAAALALALIPAGCGSSSGGDSGGAKPLSKKEYGARATKIANQFFSDVQSTQAKISGAGDQQGRVAALDGFKKAFTTLGDRIEKLAPPANLKGTQAKLVGKARESAKDIDAVTAAVKAKSKAKAQAAQKALQEDIVGVKSAANALDAGSK